MGLIEELGEGPVALDTAIFIYLIEEHPDFCPLVDPVFAGMNEERIRAVTSAITLLEVLVLPMRSRSSALARRYEELLTRGRGLRLIPLDRGQLRAAARIRGATRIATPDALQIAAAIGSGCSALLTNDRRLPERIGDLRIHQLSAWLAD